MKVCVIGLDGATWDLLDPWLDDLPTIRSFADHVRADLESCVPPLSIPAWKVYSTGMDPGQLGVFTFVDPDFRDQRLKTVSNETFTHREIWDYLGDDGLESAVINMPTTYPPRAIPGSMVSGPFAGEQRDYTYPAHLEQRLEDRDYAIHSKYYVSQDRSHLADATESLTSKLDLAASLADDVDFIHATLYQTDTVQHAEWDSPHAKSFWENVDRVVGEFVETLGEEWNVVLMSDHGFGETKGIFYLNTWLNRNGYMDFQGGGVDIGDVMRTLGIDHQRARSLLTRLRLTGVVRSVLPTHVMRKIDRQLPGNRKLEGIEDKMDWDSDAIGLAPLIYTKTDRIAEELRADLLAIEDRNGNPVIDEVHYGSELYPDCEVRIPDLVIDHTDYKISDVHAPDKLLVYEPDDWVESWVAHHRRTGILSARGPDVAPVSLEDAHLWDLAPTILEGFGLDVPTEMRGESLGLLGSDGRRADVPTRLGTERVVEHDSTVERRLEELGYL